MSTASVPNTFSAAAVIIASQHNANFAALVNLLNGNIDHTNFGTLGGLVTWSVTSNALCITSGNSGTEGSAKFSHTGILASSKSVFWVTSSAAQTTGDAVAHIEATSSSTSIPGLLITYAGAAAGALASKVVSTTAPSLPFPSMSTAQKAALSSPATGAGVFDSTLGRHDYYTGAQWRKIGDKENVVTKTTTYTSTAADDVILCTTAGGSWTLTLIAAASVPGKRVIIKKTDSNGNLVTIDGNGAETIDGAASFNIYTQYETLEIVSDGSNWHILQHQCSTEPASYTPTITGCGTVANLSAKWWRTGGFLNLAVSFECGTVAASTASFTYPSVVSASDITKLGAFGSRAPVGTCHFTNAGGGSGVFTSSGGCAVIIAEDVSTTLGYFCVTNSTDADSVVFSAQNGSTIFTTGANVSFYARIPVSGWKE